MFGVKFGISSHSQKGQGFVIFSLPEENGSEEVISKVLAEVEDMDEAVTDDGS